jgi:RNA polymerase sigma factor (sigma-70 family)
MVVQFLYRTMTRRSSRTLDRPPETSTSVYEAYTRHGLSLKRFIGRFLRSSADIEDIAQETFLRAYAVERGRPIEQPKSFLFRIAKHVALSQLTRKSRQLTDYLEDSYTTDYNGPLNMESASSAEDEVSAREILALHCEAVATLGSHCRQAFLLRKVHNLSHKEIAKQLGIAVSTVEKHLIKAVERCDRYVRERTELTHRAVERARPSQAAEAGVTGSAGWK